MKHHPNTNFPVVELNWAFIRLLQDTRYTFTQLQCDKYAVNKNTNIFQDKHYTSIVTVINYQPIMLIEYSLFCEKVNVIYTV